MLSSRPTSVMSDIEKGFITCKETLCAACSFILVLWVYSLVSSPFPYIICLCVCLTKKEKKRKILSVVKSSHISNVWYWEGIYYLLCDTNCRLQFWFWSESVFPCLIPLRLYICVYVCVVKSSHIGNVRYWEEVYHLQGDTMCRM